MRFKHLRMLSSAVLKLHLKLLNFQNQKKNFPKNHVESFEGQTSPHLWQKPWHYLLYMLDGRYFITNVIRPILMMLSHRSRSTRSMHLLLFVKNI
jgi:homoserine trans-succinylase